MLYLKLRLILLVISCFALLFFVNLIRKERIDIKYALLWLFTSIIFIFLSLFVKSSYYIAELFGIEMPVNALFLVGIITLLLISFSLTVALSKTTTMINSLTQEIALLKNKLEKLQSYVKEHCK